MAETIEPVVCDPFQVNISGITGNVIHFGRHDVAADIAAGIHFFSNVDILINPICIINYNEISDIINIRKYGIFNFYWTDLI